jgi:hypothetical protein
MEMIRLSFAIATILAGLSVTEHAWAGATENAQAAEAAAAYLELATTQNPDGSYGATEDIRPLETAAVVDAFRAYNRRDNAYFRAITWLENHAMGNVDYHARRAKALAPHGDDISVDEDFLTASVSQQVEFQSGWGLSGAYAASPRDTALALIALAASGPGAEFFADVDSGIAYLETSQLPDGSWPVQGGSQGDAVVTATALRALAGLVAFDPSVDTAAGLAAGYLLAAAPAGSEPLVLAKAARARIAWLGAGSASSQIDSLVAAQSPGGSWSASAYVTASSLHALAAELEKNTASYQQVIPLADFELRSAVNLSLGRNRGDQIRRGDLEQLTSLDANGLAIADLTGLENASSLTFLDLRNTNVTDIGALGALPSTVIILLQNTPWAGLLCDITDSGQIDTGDGIIAARIASGSHTPTLLEKTRSDVAPTSGPGDGVVGAGDALLVARRASGLTHAACP